MPTTLWNFTLAFYARPGAEACLLRLQDSGANVCALICGIWLGKAGVRCDAVRAQALSRLADDWEARVVGPLRTVRRAWKTESGNDVALANLREALKRLELEAEAELVKRLEALVMPWKVNGARDTGAWLACLAPAADHDALDSLRAMAEQV